MIVFKIDILNALNSAGYSSYNLKKKNIIGGAILQKFRQNNASIDYKTINKLCELLDMQPGDILEYVPDPETDQTAERLNSD